MRERTPLLHLPVHLSDSRTALHCTAHVRRRDQWRGRAGTRAVSQIRSDQMNARGHMTYTPAMLFPPPVHALSD
jgi:hypothetical protein